MSLPKSSAERGISLIEIMIALTILSTALIALGGLMFQVARQTRSSEQTSYLTAASQREAAWMEQLPWDSIVTAVGCQQDTVGALAYDRCVTQQTVTSNLKRVTVVISPVGVSTVSPDTVVIDRNRPRSRSPLKSG